MSDSRTLKGKIPVKWSNFWNSRELFPLLVDPAVDEDRFTFNDNEVTFFTEPTPAEEERYRRLIGQRSFWGLSPARRKELSNKKQPSES